MITRENLPVDDFQKVHCYIRRNKEAWERTISECAHDYRSRRSDWLWVHYAKEKASGSKEERLWRDKEFDACMEMLVAKESVERAKEQKQVFDDALSYLTNEFLWGRELPESLEHMVSNALKEEG